MMKRWTLLFALTLAAAPAAAQAQQGGNGGQWNGPRAGAREAARPGPRFAAGPLRFFEQHSAELKLTPDQLQKIRARNEQLQAANRPLLEKLQAARGQGAPQGQADREAMRRRMQALRPTMEQVRKNSETAWKDALGYLNKDQVTQAEQLRKAQMEKRRDGARRQGDAQGKGAWQSRGAGAQGGV